MLVEDDASTRSALERIFARRGWDVRSTASRAEALALVAEGFEVVILDLMLPDGDGTEVLRAVRAAGLPTRVVVATGTNDAQLLRAVRALAPAALLSKPINLADLDAAVAPDA